MVRLALRQAGSGQFEVLPDRDRMERFAPVRLQNYKRRCGEIVQQSLLTPSFETTLSAREKAQ